MDPNFLSEKKKKEFEKWYDSVKHQEFNFKNQFMAYCWSDVMLLANGCLAFRKIFMDKTKKSETDIGVDPSLCAFTIASLCHYIYRRNLLEPKSIGIIPENGYHPEQKTSIKCQLWLKYLPEKTSDTFNPIKQELMSTSYNRHLKRINFIKESITENLVEIWECEWDALITENENLKKFVESTNKWN
ncbi:unnamed protein product [Brachionus calyciflorus]|uniref:Uncharacterized protein n=1 Tax=Brachionus calyciflorus TaxID=104777 RepID=A0A814HXT9_9BILA|nr:unnamed protein product [Brachionus calyciflorus]